VTGRCGFAKVELQNLLIAAACNIKRWLRVLRGEIAAAYPLKELFNALQSMIGELLLQVRLFISAPAYLD
jgi:hypothetical protein